MNWDFKVNSKDKTEVINEVQEKKAKAKTILTMEEAWAKIGKLKNTEGDKKKLREVFIAFQEGKIGREPDSVNKSFSKAEALRQWSVLQETQRQEKLDKMVEETPDNYELVMDIVSLGAMMNVLEKEDYIPVDTETKGLKLYHKDYIVGVSLTAPNQDRHYYIPLRHDEANAPLKSALNVIGKILSWNKEFIFHNASFDLHQFANEGIFCSNGVIHDTQEIMKVLNENETSYRLKDLVTKYLKLPSDTFSTLFGNTPFNEVALKYARYYGCKDTHVTWLLFDYQMKYLKAQTGLLNYYLKVEQPLIRVVWEMEREGFIPVLDEADKVSAELTVVVDKIRAELLEVLGDINLDSPTQLLPALQRTVDPKMTSTAKAELKKRKTNPLVGKLLEYRELHKLNKDFISRLRDFIQPDGKIHGSFSQNGARTGRFSSKEPNLQQIPPKARAIYRVDDDSLILGLDFSAQEPRMLAHYSQEPVLLKNYSEGKDLYASLASEFYNKPYADCYKLPNGDDTKERKTFKVVVLAIMYGMGASSLGSSLGITTKEAQAILDKFNQSFPKVAEFVKSNTKEACKQGFVEMRIDELGIIRKRRLPFFKGENPNKVYDTYSTNAKIQGTSAIQTKLCMVEGNKLCKELSTPDRHFALLASVHDELLYKVPKDITVEERQRFEAIMLYTVKLKNIPSGTDAELGNNWGKMTKVVS